MDMVKIARKDLPQYLKSLEELLNSSCYDFIAHQYDGLYEFIFKHYPELLPDDTVTLHDIMDDITPALVLEYLLEEGRVELC
jgi:hypothetical protein